MFRFDSHKKICSCRAVTRRHFFQIGAAAFGIAVASRSRARATGRGEMHTKGALKSIERNKQQELLWQPGAEFAVSLLPPSFVATSEKQGRIALPLRIQLSSHRVDEDRASFDYELTIDDSGTKRMGKYTVKYSLGSKDERRVLTQNTALGFDEPLRFNLTVVHTLQMTGKKVVTCTLPLRYGVVRAFEVEEGQKIAGYYVLGQGSTAQKGEELALPVIGLDFDAQIGGTLAVATDPYCGSQFRVCGASEKAPNESLVTTSYTYMGSMVPLREEERTEVYVVHKGGIDGMLRSFYDVIPEIHPSPSWVQSVQLNYYDDISSYKSEPGQGWYHDVQKLAEKIPTEHRGKVVLCLEGYYDYVGRYCYDHEKRQLAEAWDAYDMKAAKVPMTLTEVHKRIKFAKDRGFRVMWYFADGMSSDTTSPYYRKNWVIIDEKGGCPSRGFWEWRPEFKDKMPPGPFPVLPDEALPTNHLLDPGNSEVIEWFVGYMEALLKEYGRELDGFTWDETFLVKVGTISTTGSTPTYSDRAFMRLLSRLSQVVQEWHKINPDLVLMASDDGFTPYALVAHGTYQDSGCSPSMWPPCLLINYRTCLWSCNWTPVKEDNNNAFAVRKYGLPQGLSNGFGDLQGPAEMPAEILDCVIQRFLKRVSDGRDRTRYLRDVLDAMTFSAYDDRCACQPPALCFTP